MTPNINLRKEDSENVVNVVVESETICKKNVASPKSQIKQSVMLFIFLSVSLCTYSQKPNVCDDYFQGVQAAFSFSPFQETSTGENAKLLALDCKYYYVWEKIGILTGLDIRSYNVGYETDTFMLSKYRKVRFEINVAPNLRFFNSSDNFGISIYVPVGLWYAGVVDHKPKIQPTLSFGFELTYWRISIGAAWKSKRTIYPNDWKSNVYPSASINSSFEFRVAFHIWKDNYEFWYYDNGK